MFDCVVCRYWSERLVEARTHGGDKNALEHERSLMAALRTHQSGACARRFPDLLRDLVKQQPELPVRVRRICDPARARILTDSRYGEFEVMATCEWQ